MKNKFLVALALLGLLLAPATASAVYIDFDSLPVGNIDGVHLGTFPDGVRFTSGDGSTMVTTTIGGDPTKVGWTSPFQAVTNFGFVTSGHDLTLTFDRGRGIVEFTGGDEGGDLDQFSVSAYDANNNLLLTLTTPVFGGHAITPDGHMNDNYKVTLETFGGQFMKYVVIHDAINAGIGIDDLTFCHPVPVPPSLLLLGSGLLGLVGFGIRRRKS